MAKGVLDSLGEEITGTLLRFFANFFADSQSEPMAEVLLLQASWLLCQYAWHSPFFSFKY